MPWPSVRLLLMLLAHNHVRRCVAASASHACCCCCSSQVVHAALRLQLRLMLEPGRQLNAQARHGRRVLLPLRLAPCRCWWRWPVVVRV
jgi:hypothetical protein